RFQIEQIFPTPDHHAKLRPPIADVIVTNNVVTEELRDARESIAQKGAANVSDMHRLRDIRRPEINHDFSWRGNFFNPESLVAQQLRDFFLSRFPLESEVNETGAGHTRLLGNLCDFEPADDRLSYLARIFTALFSEGERSVALV